MTKLNTRRGILAAAGLAVVALAIPAFAETTYMRIDIPFQFLAGNEVLPAGTYHVDVSNNFNYADFRSTNETRIHRVLLSSGRIERTPSKSEYGTLQFQRYGDKLVLRGVWNAWRSEGYVFQKSKAERELARGVPAGGIETIESFNK